MAAFCEQCGSALDEGARFCRSCGKPLAGPATGPAAAAQPAPAQPAPVAPPPQAPAAAASWATPQPAPPPWALATAQPKKGSRLPKVLGGLALFAVVVVVLALLATSGPADAVSAHLAALASGDDATAYSYTSADFRKATNLAAFSAFVNANPIFRAAKADISSRTVTGSSAQVIVDLTPPGGSKRTAEFQLTQEEGDWKIIGYMLRAAGTP